MVVDLIVIGVILAGVVVVGFLLVRSFRRWLPTRGTSPEAKEAEARLWQTRSMDQR